jgi:hypothetical protein
MGGEAGKESASPLPASDPPPVREEVALPLHAKAVPTSWEVAEPSIDVGARWVEGGKGREKGWA